jgi:hypothetical protein
MKIFCEKEAEEFLGQEGFRIVESVYVKKESEIQNAVKKIDFPLVMKVSGKNIVHKNRVKGVSLGVKSHKEALKEYKRLKKIKFCEGILVQKEIKEKEFLAGIKRTPEFGHVIVFGVGGVDVEKLGKVNFRVCPIKKNDAEELINDVFIGSLTKEKTEGVKKFLLKLCQLIQRKPNILELDVNPLMVHKGVPIIIDARIVFD